MYCTLEWTWGDGRKQQGGLSCWCSLQCLAVGKGGLCGCVECSSQAQLPFLFTPFSPCPLFLVT